MLPNDIPLNLLTACLAGAVVFVLDQLSKSHALRLKPAVSNGFVHIRCFVNRSGLLAVKPGFALLSLWLLCAAAALTAVLQLPLAGHPLACVGVGMIAGGVSGNFSDLQRRGAIVDFIAVGSFTIFNLADVAIVSGVGLVALAVL
jgi:signal peptidase II